MRKLANTYKYWEKDTFKMIDGDFYIQVKGDRNYPDLDFSLDGSSYPLNEIIRDIENEPGYERFNYKRNLTFTFHSRNKDVVKAVDALINAAEGGVIDYDVAEDLLEGNIPIFASDYSSDPIRDDLTLLFIEEQSLSLVEAAQKADETKVYDKDDIKEALYLYMDEKWEDVLESWIDEDGMDYEEAGEELLREFIRKQHPLYGGRTIKPIKPVISGVNDRYLLLS